MNYYSHNIGDFTEVIPRHKLEAVYVLATPNFEFIKIGISRSFKQRISNIQTACPFELTVWQIIRTPIAAEIEMHLHKAMAHCHARGEWFKPSEADLDALADFFAKTNAEVKRVLDALL